MTGYVWRAIRKAFLEMGRGAQTPAAQPVFFVWRDAALLPRRGLLADLVHELIDPLVNLRLLLGSLVSSQPTDGDSLIDACVSGALQRRRNITRRLVMRLSNLDERLAIELGAQLFGRDADGRCRGIQVKTTRATGAAEAAATTRAAWAPWGTTRLISWSIR